MTGAWIVAILLAALAVLVVGGVAFLVRKEDRDEDRW